jgi:hypothetical protein
MVRSHLGSPLSNIPSERVSVPLAMATTRT